MAKLFDNGHALNLVKNAAGRAASPSTSSDTEHHYGALLVGEMKRRKSMDERHGLLHKKQSGAAADLTDALDLSADIAPRYPPSATAAPVEAGASVESVPAEVPTGVDDSVATVVTVETVVFAEASAAVEAAPAGPNNPPGPTVPSVPAFPTNLTVPVVPTATWESIPVVVDYPFPPSSAPESLTEPVAEQATPTATSQSSLASLQPSSQLIIQSPPATPLPSETTFASSPDSSTTSAASATLSGSDPVVSAAARPTVSSALSQGGSLLTGSTLRTTATASVRTSSGSSLSGSANPTISVQAASASSGRSSLFTSAGTVYVVSVNANSRITQTLPASAISSVSLSPSALRSSPTEVGSDSEITSAAFGPSPFSSGEASATDTSGTASFAASDPAVATGTPVVGLPGAPGEPGAAPAATASASSSAESNNDGDSGESPAVPTRTVVGGVVGGIAGMAVLLLILLMILKWYRRRRGAPLRLPDHSTPSADPFSDDAHPMEERHRSNLLPVAAAGFMRKISGGTPPPSSAAPERGFQRISGRKLPSAHSPGMTSADVPAPLHSPAALSDSSFYRDSQGFYGGPGVVPPPTTTTFGGPSRSAGIDDKDFEKAALDKETIMPSPARTPVVTQSAVQRSSSFLTQDTRSPPRSAPRSDGRPDTGLTVLSTVSQGGSRSSKFVEEDKWRL
ncbi:hypothetical protein H2201_001604 [Coniosporium apollinis]|uniref:Mid2 domain-containing protein n=1 Tax=Coniosporium apollinis TaxID=61459 RepID=A0ABQ9P0Q1_9PEZI|nr:hypothetical protein H2201_001604 [Coniosporium apollinis]